MKSARCESYQHVAGAHARRLGNSRALDNSHREAGQVVLAGLVESAQLRSLAADQAHARLITSARDTFDDVERDFLFELARPDVIEKEQRPRRVADDVVDAHRNAVDADGVVTPGLEREHQLGADAVRARDQHRRAHLAGAVQPDQRAEAADAADHVRAGCRLRDRAEQRNQALLQRDIDARRFVGHPGRHQLDFLRAAKRRAKCALAVWISDQAFAVLFNFESVRERAKLSVTEQKARVARVADRGLVDEERVGNQPAARPERAHEFREQRAVEEIYVHDGVERFVLEMKAIQVCDDGPDAKPRGARSRGENAHRFGREIHRDHLDSRVSERECVAPASGRDVERDAARHSREHLCEERLGLAGGLAAMALIPFCALRFAHSTRASVKTSTHVAPAAFSTRAHSSTVAPVVITSSTINTRRSLISSGLVTANARRTFLTRSS